MEFMENTDGRGLRFAIIASRYNEFVTSRLVRGAVAGLQAHGVADADVDIYWCPGALEIPALAEHVARAGRPGDGPYHGIICVGCVIRGETDHYTFVAGECMRGVAELARRACVGVGNAVLTVETVDQALERAGGAQWGAEGLGATNKGWEAARAALVMANFLKGTG
jgi:6,7-dimethyl-8-ribityllumazine synthase